jgi:hypothetical protein
LHLSRLSTTAHHRLSQNSRDHMVSAHDPIIFEKPGGRDY